jgi:predicted amidohydrolase
MRVGLMPLLTHVGQPEMNLDHLKGRIQEAALSKPLDLLCLPECTLTGYVYQQDDLEKFGEPIPGPTTNALANLARTHGLYLCFGLVEREGDLFYDTGVLLNPSGEIIGLHRKINEKPPYACGQSVQAFHTAFGDVSLLICGDLFSDQVTCQLPKGIKLLIVPMSRCFSDQSPDIKRWESVERQVYCEAVKEVGVTTVLINNLEVGQEDSAFGGAMVVDSAGNCCAESLHGTDQLLMTALCFS